MGGDSVERIKIIGEIEGLRSRLSLLTAWAEKAPGFPRKKQTEIADGLASAEARLGAVWMMLGGTTKPPGYVEPVHT